MELELKMSLKEVDRLRVMNKVQDKRMTLKKASEELGLSYKQTKRIWYRYKMKGPQGLVSKRGNKPSNNQLTHEFKTNILTLVKEKYADYGPTLAREKLYEKHGLKLAKETLRQLMIQEGLWKAKKIKGKKVYARRTRRSRYGELEQIDGSYDYWFEDRGDKCCLLVCVDDATSALMQLRFCNAETTQEYLTFLKEYLELHGRPLTFYSDKHSVFRKNNKEKAEGSFLTRFHEVLKELDIELICAHSPQAKGRVERANGTLQDRLIKELRERNISTIEQGNAYLEEFRCDYNKRFAVEPAHRENAHRELHAKHQCEYLFMIKEERRLSKDLSFGYKNEIYQVESEYRHRLIGTKVDIYEVSDEIKLVIQKGKLLKFKKWQERAAQPTEIVDVKQLETRVLLSVKKPSMRHPWRR
ncbi:MAG: ISNCY family transposase [Chlamydiae bacterium]|nr:ISNCY family transposase [Chlamydiota bacterium]